MGSIGNRKDYASSYENHTLIVQVESDVELEQKVLEEDGVKLEKLGFQVCNTSESNDNKGGSSTGKDSVD